VLAGKGCLLSRSHLVSSSDRSEMRSASGDRSALSCLHSSRLSDWSEVMLASGEMSLSCRHPKRLSDWSEVRPASGDRSRSCKHMVRSSDRNEMRPASGERSPVSWAHVRG
jgi:hypothetical protein